MCYLNTQLIIFFFQMKGIIILLSLLQLLAVSTKINPQFFWDYHKCNDIFSSLFYWKQRMRTHRNALQRAALLFSLRYVCKSSDFPSCERMKMRRERARESRERMDWNVCQKKRASHNPNTLACVVVCMARIMLYTISKPYSRKHRATILRTIL